MGKSGGLLEAVAQGSKLPNVLYDALLSDHGGSHICVQLTLGSESHRFPILCDELA